MNKLMAALMAAPVAIVAPYAAAATAAQHPAQVQFQQNMDAVLAVARNPQLSEAQKVQIILVMPICQTRQLKRQSINYCH